MNTDSPPISLARLFNLRLGQAAPATIDATIRDGIRVGGTNLWVLMFAIAIASIGLNVNSTAVIIGAMLISPLMGPIIGAGYGAAIEDAQLIRRSLRNLAVFVGISLLTSTLYFLVSPLGAAHSELVARTTPTIWDVAIAFFGGAAGMVGLSRQEKTTVIPGVAIATALMPPLCTAGYGLAHGEPRFLLGAFYLFTINGVYIALATVLVTRLLRLPRHAFANEKARVRARVAIGAIVTVTLAPSAYLAVQMVGEEVFGARSERFVAALRSSERDLVLLRHATDARERRIMLSVLGGEPGADLQRRLESRLAEHGLAGVRLEIRRPSEAQRDAALGRQAAERVAEHGLLRAQEELSARIAALESQLGARKAADAGLARLGEEIRAQSAGIREVLVARAAGSSPGSDRLVLVLIVDRPLPAAEIRRLRRWLAVRLPDTDFELISGKVAG